MAMGMETHRPDRHALAGWHVLVTRPAGVADSLCDALAGHGACVHRAPLLAIEPLAETAAERALARDLDRFDVVIVTSRHAVQHGIARLADSWPQWPHGIRWLAVGAATAAALAAHGIVAGAPDDARSEGLLALPELADIDGRRVLLLTGEGGRGLLETTLAARGARVSRLATYRRVAAAGADAALDAFRDIPAGATGRAVLVTSGDALQNLLDRAPWLRARPACIIAASARIADIARAAGMPDVRVARGAGDDALLSTLLEVARDTRGADTAHEDRA